MLEDSTMTWYSCFKFILKKLESKDTNCIDYSIDRLKQFIMKDLKTLILIVYAWYNDTDNGTGKLIHIFPKTILLFS